MTKTSEHSAQWTVEVVVDLINELSFENVRLADLENAAENDELPGHDVDELKRRMTPIKDRIASSKEKLISAMEQLLLGRSVFSQRGVRPVCRIPNFNTLSTLIDRVSIENVKLVHFENAIRDGSVKGDRISETKMKIAVQQDIIQALNKELGRFVKEAILSGKYDYMKEERTFI